jgi:hypothetical protein
MEALLHLLGVAQWLEYDPSTTRSLVQQHSTTRSQFFWHTLCVHYVLILSFCRPIHSLRRPAFVHTCAHAQVPQTHATCAHRAHHRYGGHSHAEGGERIDRDRLRASLRLARRRRRARSLDQRRGMRASLFAHSTHSCASLTCVCMRVRHSSAVSFAPASCARCLRSLFPPCRREAAPPPSEAQVTVNALHTLTELTTGMEDTATQREEGELTVIDSAHR